VVVVNYQLIFISKSIFKNNIAGFNDEQAPYPVSALIFFLSPTRLFLVFSVAGFYCRE